MANAEQLEILKQGAEGWNRWRNKNFTIEIDLSEANLNGADLRVATLTCSDLTAKHPRKIPYKPLAKFL